MVGRKPGRTSWHAIRLVPSRLERQTRAGGGRSIRSSFCNAERQTRVAERRTDRPLAMQRLFPQGRTRAHSAWRSTSRTQAALRREIRRIRVGRQSAARREVRWPGPPAGSPGPGSASELDRSVTLGLESRRSRIRTLGHKRSPTWIAHSGRSAAVIVSRFPVQGGHTGPGAM